MNEMWVVCCLNAPLGAYPSKSDAVKSIQLTCQDFECVGIGPDHVAYLGDGEYYVAQRVTLSAFPGKLF